MEPAGGRADAGGLLRSGPERLAARERPAGSPKTPVRPGCVPIPTGLRSLPRAECRPAGVIGGAYASARLRRCDTGGTVVYGSGTKFGGGDAGADECVFHGAAVQRGAPDGGAGPEGATRPAYRSEAERQYRISAW